MPVLVFRFTADSRPSGGWCQVGSSVPMPDSYRNFASIFLALSQHLSGDVLAPSLKTALSLQQGRGVADKNGKAAGGLPPRHGWAATRPDAETSKRLTGEVVAWLNHPR